MNRTITKMSIYCSLFLLLAGTAKAQDTTAEFHPGGRLWGYTFGDFAYKGSADNLNRGGSNQYTGMPANANTFQFRRIYLGYNYDISPKFSAEFLLAAEDDYTAGSITQGPTSTSVGDVTGGGKFTPYVKYANLKWKNIFKNSDLKIGSQATPSFAKTDRNDQTAEEVWGYRSVERTVSDIRRTPSFDMGASLQGWFDNKGRYGYMLMASNGQQAKPGTSIDKMFSGDVYAKFFDKRLIIDLFADYQRLVNTTVSTGAAAWDSWGAWANPGKATDPNGPDYESRNMTKLFIAWNTNKLTIGFEGFQNVFLGGLQCTGTDKNMYYRTFSATDLSFYVRGRILSARNGDPRLNFFARYDTYNPSGGLSTAANNPDFTKIAVAPGVSNYDPFTEEQFVTFGIDYMPFKNVHIIPNVWVNTYTSSLSVTGENSSGELYSKLGYGGSELTGVKGTDAVYRLTIYYIYNPKQGTTKY
jgi:hypothetical protein